MATLATGVITPPPPHVPAPCTARRRGSRDKQIMATDRPTGGGVFDGPSLRRRGDRRTDHISGLPDHLLHRILLGLPGGASSAARTSVLSRRWRRVWSTLPALLFRYTFGNEEPPPSSSSSPPADRVEAALAAYSAPTVRRLDIAMPYGSRRRPSHPTAEHLRLVVPWWRAFAPPNDDDDEVDVVLLPVCERVTSIHLVLGCYILRFRPPTTIADAGGAFKALAALKISDACVDGPELEEMLSSRRCPCLKKLELERISLRQGGPPVLSLRSDSLEWLQIAIEYRGRLQVAAPNLRTFHGRSIPCEIYMAAPMLSEVSWHNNFGYDPTRHHLAVSGHHLRRLEIRADSSGLKLMRQFNIVDELHLNVHVMEYSWMRRRRTPTLHLRTDVLLEPNGSCSRVAFGQYTYTISARTPTKPRRSLSPSPPLHPLASKPPPQNPHFEDTFLCNTKYGYVYSIIYLAMAHHDGGVMRVVTTTRSGGGNDGDRDDENRLLSRRWRGVWTRLPLLILHAGEDAPPPRVRRFANHMDGVLRGYSDADVDVDNLFVWVDSDTVITNPVRLAAAAANLAARRVTGRLAIFLSPTSADMYQMAGDGEAVLLQLPCLPRVTDFSLTFIGVHLKMPMAGTFASLTSMYIAGVRFTDDGEGISDVVSSRCPRIKILDLLTVRGLRTLTVVSRSLVSLRLCGVMELERLRVVAAELGEMVVDTCFVLNGGADAAMLLVAPALEKLRWEDRYPRELGGPWKLPGVWMALEDKRALLSHTDPTPVRRRRPVALSSDCHPQRRHPQPQPARHRQPQSSSERSTSPLAGAGREVRYCDPIRRGNLPFPSPSPPLTPADQSPLMSREAES
ncbi:hypothetical protein HU200_051519 [Digitaria exilis]|uniref:F-box domain-containing protein n=1 Tax=Digitaria exilis TaxID=1010633 RepID=A0A835AQ14_9POAL|nr:hypothetical protein HU200_051519 [Digitaria exilis]